MQLTIRSIDRSSPVLPELFRLYRASFPLIERVDFNIYLNDQTGTLDILGFFHEEAFCGFAALMTYGDLSQILYFAIEEKLRGRGYGAVALEAMRESYGTGRIMADLEDPLTQAPGSPERAERERRIHFYQRNDYQLTDVRFEWEKENYVMMISGGALTMKEYASFWKQAEDDRGEGYERMESESSEA